MKLEGTFKNEKTGDKLIFERVDVEIYFVTKEQVDGIIYGPEKIHLSLAFDNYHITSKTLLNNYLISIGQDIELNKNEHNKQNEIELYKRIE